MNHNSMDSNPISATSRWDSIIKPGQDCDKLLLDDKMRSTFTLNKIDMMFRVHGDST